MIEQWLSDPSKVSALVLMAIAVVAFYKVLVLPRQTHVEAIAQLVSSHKQAVDRYELDLRREREENDRLRALVNRNVEVVDKSLDALQAAQHAFEAAHAARREAFGQPDRERESS